MAESAISRILSAGLRKSPEATIYLGGMSPFPSSDLPEYAADGHPSEQPGRRRRRAYSYLVLHRAGFAEPAELPPLLVGSYPTVSPLPGTRASRAVYFLLHFPSACPRRACCLRVTKRTALWSSDFPHLPVGKCGCPPTLQII